jgi:hypothetical protein
MRVIPANNIFGAICGFQKLKHFLLKNFIDGFNTNSSATLRHREDVDNFDRILVNKISQEHSWAQASRQHEMQGETAKNSPMTSIGTPARPCFSILSSASEEMYMVSAVSLRGMSG